MFFRLIDGDFHRRIISMGLRVDEKIIFPIHFFAGTLFDISEVDAVFLEDVEDFGNARVCEPS